jgi:HopA1 effector protein family
MSIYVDQIRRMVEAITIVSAGQLWWYGRSMSAASTKGESGYRQDVDMPNFKANLQGHLYQYFYCTGGATPWPPGSAQGHEQRGFRTLLARSSSSPESWSNGWKVWEVSQGRGVGVAYNGVQWWASESDVAKQEEIIAPGCAVTVRVPAERLREFPGFYGIFGGKDLVNRRIARFYWNLECDGAPILIRELSASLNAAAIAHRMKVISDASRYCRCDAGVLYIHQSDFGHAVDSVSQAYSVVRSQLKPQVPALTRPLAPGLGFAENPANSASFGFQRCGLIAEALIDSHLRHISSVSGRIDAIAERFEREGISLDVPYLNAGSSHYSDKDLTGAIVVG